MVFFTTQWPTYHWNKHFTCPHNSSIIGQQSDPITGCCYLTPNFLTWGGGGDPGPIGGNIMPGNNKGSTQVLRFPCGSHFIILGPSSLITVFLTQLSYRPWWRTSLSYIKLNTFKLARDNHQRCQPEINNENTQMEIAIMAHVLIPPARHYGTISKICSFKCISKHC